MDSTINQFVDSIKQAVSPDELDKNEWYEFSFMFKVLDDGTAVSKMAMLGKAVVDVPRRNELKLCQDYYKKVYGE